MAIFHLSFKAVSRARGHSSIAKAAYRAAEKLFDQRLDKTYDYTNKNDVFYKEIMSPDKKVSFIENRESLWNHVEASEKRKDARPANEIEVALPKELSEEQNIALIKEYVKSEFLSKEVIADVCLHRGHGADQPHAHIMLVTRELKDGELGRKVERLYERSFVYEQREKWSGYANKHLALAGFDLTIDHRSNKDRGIDLEPQNKRGPENGSERFTEKFLEHEQIARRNGEKIYNDPKEAIKALTYYQSTFTLYDLAKFINTHTADKEQFDKVFLKVQNSTEIVKLGTNDKGQTKYTSQAMVNLEYKMVRQSQTLSNLDRHRVDLKARENIAQDKGLSKNQQEAFRHITGDRDLACVVGYAGTGKSYMLGAAKESWEKEGYNVIGMTLSGIAAESLEASSGIKSYTVRNRTVNWDNDRERLTKNDIVVVDEAAMLGSRDLSRIIEEAVSAGSKVVLVGDTEQLQAIEAGAAFRGIIERVGHLEINEIRRQKELWQQEATKSLAIGEIGDAINAYKNKEMVHEFNTSDNAQEQIVNDWHEVNLEEKSSIMLAYTRKEVKALNDRARIIKKSYGELGEDSEYETDRGKRNFAVGDRVYFLKNDKELNVKNGTLGTIDKLNGDRFMVTLDKGSKVKFNIKDYDSIDHGYASTIHKSQGLTVDQTFLLPSKYMDRHATYVALSRHRYSVDVYWSNDVFKNLDTMINNLARINRKELSIDYLSKDYRDNTSIFASNKSIELNNEIEGLKEPDGLKYFNKNSKLMSFVNTAKQEFQYSYAGCEMEHMRSGKYLGDFNIDNIKVAMIEFGGIAGYFLENVNIKEVAVGDDVTVLHGVDKQGIDATTLLKKSQTNTIKSMYNYEKAQATINSIGRKLSSKEHYEVDNKISTKDIYSALYNKLPTVLSEFGFVQKGNCYVSTTGQKIDGTSGHKGKVYVYANNPGLLVDYTRGNRSIWDYISETEGISDKSQIFNYLASVSGIKPYFEDTFKRLKNNDNAPSPLENNIDTERKSSNQSKPESSISSEIWEKIYEYSQEKIRIQNNQVSKYLKQERGYDNSIIKISGIGYIPNKKELINYLEKQGLDSENSKELLKTLGCIGYTHKMVIPYYNKNRELIGLAARNIKHTEGSKFGKYIYSKGLARSSTMLGIEHVDYTRPVTIVEGMLDVLHARAAGIDNVVAIGGTGMNIKQLELLDSLSIEKVVLCLDNDKAGREATKNIACMINEKSPNINISTVTMPNKIKDLDQLIRDKGIVEAADTIEQAKSINLYALKEEKELKMIDKFKLELDGYEFDLEYKMPSNKNH